MPTTLKINNTDDADFEVTTDAGTETETIPAGGERELESRFLESASFARGLAEGKLRFVQVVDPSAEQYLLARRVMPGLLRKLGIGLVELHQRLVTVLGQLEERREEYNRLWERTEKVLEAAEERAASADHLSRGLAHFLKNQPEKDRVDTLVAELEALQEEDLDATGRSFEEWHADFTAKERELRRARLALDALERHSLRPLAPLRQALEDAADDFKDADSETDIGSQIPAF